MWRAWHLGVTVVGCMLLGVSAAGAQTNASIAGIVRDPTGGVLPGVTVDVSSPALIEKARTVVTDGSGQYKSVELKPGTYAVTFTLAGFSSVRREGIELTTGFNASVNAELRVGDIAETITVSGSSPVVDIQNVRQQVVISRDVVDSIPSGKYFQNLAVLIPGVTLSRAVVGTGQDVGGQGGQGSSSMAIHGGRANDMEILVDGMNTSSWNRLDSSVITFTDGNVAEYAVEVAGKSAEAETAGIRVNMIPREGGNTFKGSFFGNFANPSLQSSNITPELVARGLPAANRVKLLWNVNPTVGGPLSKDRLWFFGSYSRLRSDNYIGGVFFNANPASWTYTPDTTRQGFNDQITDDGAVRLTWQATRRNKLAVYYDLNKNCNCHFLVTPNVSPEAGVVSLGTTHLVQVTSTSPVTNRFLVEAGFSTLPQHKSFDPDPTAVAPQITEQARGFSYRSRANLYRKENFQNRTLRASASYVTGGHAAKVGFNAVFGSADVVNYDPFGNVAYTVLNGNPVSATYYGYPTTQQDYMRPNLGVYAQDQWALKRVTINAGLRFDYLRTGYPDGNIPPTQFVPVSRAFSGIEVLNWKSVSPRLGVAYDLFGNGKTAIKASLGHYVLADGLSRRSLNPAVQNNSTTRTWIDANGNRIVDGNPLDVAANGELGRSTNASFGQAVLNARYDPEWAKGFNVRAYNWEMSTGIQHELLPRVAVNAAYFRRWFGDFEQVDNLAVGPADYTTYCVTAPTDSRLPGGGGQQVCGLFDLNPSKVGQVNNITTSTENYGARLERWNGVDLTANARLGDGVLLQGGVSTGKTVDDRCEVVIKVDNPSTRFCRTTTPLLTQFKLLGSYRLPWQILLAGTFQSIPGPEIAANYIATSAQVAPSLGRPLSSAATVTVNLVEPGTMYGERMNQLDVRIAKIFTIEGVRMQGSIDLYNALNVSPALQQNNAYGTNGASWQVPQSVLPARLVKFAVQVNF